MSSIKNILRKLIPFKIRSKISFFRNILLHGRLKDYLVQRKQFKKDKSTKPSDLSIYLSIAAIVKNEVPYIAEWIEYHLLVGVQKFYIYDNESSDNLKDYLLPYIRDGIVEYNYFPGIRQQINAYNDSIKRYKYSSFWIAYIDVDEFLVPIKNSTVTDFLKNFEDVPGVEINQLRYGSSGHKTKTDGLVMERFKDHAPFDNSPNGSKSIVNPRYVFYMSTVHEAEYFNGKPSYNSHKNINIESSTSRPAYYDIIYYNHYACKSLEEFKARFERGRAISPGKLTMEHFYERDQNDIKNDSAMDKYIEKVKENIYLRFKI